MFNSIVHLYTLTYTNNLMMQRLDRYNIIYFKSRYIVQDEYIGKNN